jgi:hypothetical protein
MAFVISPLAMEGPSYTFGAYTTTRWAYSPTLSGEVVIKGCNVDQVMWSMFRMPHYNRGKRMVRVDTGLQPGLGDLR